LSIRKHFLPIVLLALGLSLLIGCGRAPAAGSAPAEPLPLPTVTARGLDRPLRVLATTSLIGDTVAQVGGEAIDLTTLIAAGQDPHGYQPGAADLTAAADADVIFVNGWDLEEGLIEDLTAIGGAAAIVPVSAGIAPRMVGGAPDPHTWQNPANVGQWVENVRLTLGAADPANAATYDANAAAYRAELERLDEEVRSTLAAVPAARRVLVTNHDNLGYFAEAYDFEVIGAVIPSVSALAEPTAAGLADLAQLMADNGLCALVVESTADDRLARALEGELDECDGVQLLTLYTDALGPPGSGVDTYLGLMRTNAATLVEGLQ
jgi:ABC-type Zn uptake system ZnuABC Zn-binding protein ZnuA